MNRGLGRYIANRLGFAGLMLAGVSVILFTLMRLAPGGPEAVLIGGEFSQEVAAQVRQRLGLDRPLPAQYGTWVLAAARGDLGRSFKTGDPNARDFRVQDVSPSEAMAAKRLERRESLLKAVDGLAKKVEGNDQIATYDEFHARAREMVLSTEARTAFAIERGSSSAVREASSSVT